MGGANSVCMCACVCLSVHCTTPVACIASHMEFLYCPITEMVGFGDSVIFMAGPVRRLGTYVDPLMPLGVAP